MRFLFAHIKKQELQQSEREGEEFVQSVFRFCFYYM